MANSNNRDIVFDNFPSTSEFKPGINHLFAIGIDDYQHVAKLSNAARDAKDFVQLMQDKYDFSSENIYTLYDAEATKKKITETFRELIDKVDKIKDNVVIYFSGHGHYDDVLKEGYWVPVSAKFQAEVDYISYSYIKKVVKAIPSHHTVMIVDSCYSGSVLMGSRDLMADRVERDPSRWMVASGRNEVVPDGVIGGNSPFAENLLGILDRYADQGLRLGTLVEKLTTAVSYNSKQTPIGRPMYEVGDQGGEFIFHPKQTPEKAWAKAQQENSVAAYAFFLSKHQSSKFAKDAQAKLTQLQKAAQPSPTQGIRPQAPVLENSAPPVTNTQASRTLMTSASAIAPQKVDSNPIIESLKKRSVIYGLVTAVVIIAGIFAYSSHKKSKAKAYTLEGIIFLKDGNFAEAKAQSKTAISYAPHYEDALSLEKEATTGLNAQSLHQQGQDSLKHGHFDGAISLFGAARKLYDATSYRDGATIMQNAIENAKTEKHKLEEEKALAAAKDEEEKQRIHQKFQQMQKDSAALYYLQGNYSYAVKTYLQLDVEDTSSVANQLAMARLGATGNLPAMIEVTGHSGGDFYIGKYEITNEQFCAFLNAEGNVNDEQRSYINLKPAYTAIVTHNGKYTVGEANKKRPVTGVSWYGANAYSKWVGGQLPSHEQWKYAARGGINKSTYAFSGSNEGHKVAVYYTGNNRTYPAKVGTKAPNALGIYDMSGNAWEWSSNGRVDSKKQFIMGGSINRGAAHSHITSNYQNPPSVYQSEQNNNDLGFRIIRMVPKQAAEEKAAN